MNATESQYDFTPPKNCLEVAENPFLFIEQIQDLSDKIKRWGYQLIYDDSNVCRWCIADREGNILWRNHGLHKAISRLEQQVNNSKFTVETDVQRNTVREC